MNNRIAIISRFNENLDWINQLKIPYVIYNKGKNDIFFPYVSISNIGRESETFLRYIIENYDVLPEEMVFLQGKPFDHCRDVILYTNERSIDDKNNFYSITNKLIYLLNDGDPDIPTECDINGNPHHPGLPIKDILFQLGINYSGPFLYASGAQYVVSKSCIVSKPLEWWKHVYNVHNNNHSSPWVFERIWPLIYASEI
jgi:hypothetical protein